MILLTDPSPTYIKAATQYLEEIGFQVVTADTPRELVRAFAYNYESLEAVIFDRERNFTWKSPIRSRLI